MPTSTRTRSSWAGQHGRPAPAPGATAPTGSLTVYRPRGPKRLRPYLHPKPEVGSGVLRDRASRGARLRAIRSTPYSVSEFVFDPSPPEEFED